jgi:membrane AbrB-like protein
MGLAIGAAGGALAVLLHVPAPWLAGSMIAGVIAIYAGVDFVVPEWLRIIAFILLGVQTGASVTWDTLARASQWPLSLAFLSVTVIAVTWSSYAYYRRARHWDAATAFFRSLPGALSLVLAIADEAKADMRKVTISQCIRLFFLVAALPAIVELISPQRNILPPLQSAGFAGAIVMVAAAAVAGLLLERLRVPAGLILGATLGSAALSLLGFAQGGAPPWVLIPANVVLGILIAARFRNFSLGELRASLAASMGGFLIALAVSVAGAVATSSLASLPFALTLLAFSPGGLDTMTIMAFALNLDPAYVASHQIARYIGMCLLLPPIAAWLMKRKLGGALPAASSED